MRSSTASCRLGAESFPKGEGFLTLTLEGIFHEEVFAGVGFSRGVGGPLESRGECETQRLDVLEEGRSTGGDVSSSDGLR